jgi:hypothetical protein
MKTIILSLFCLTLTTAATSAKDYHLVPAQLQGAPLAGKPPQLPIVYVLLAPDITGKLNPRVYQTFDSKDMELDIALLIRSDLIEKGSVLHLDLQPDLELPSNAQLDAFSNFCKKQGITLAPLGIIL